MFQQRRSSEETQADPTIWPLAPHTGVKHDIYDGYLDAWLPILFNGGYPSVTYAEGYAGPGIYTDGELGSPVRALLRVQAARAVSPGLAAKPVRMVFVEKRRDRVEELIRQLSHKLGHPMTNGEYRDRNLHVLVRQGPCETTLPTALNEVSAGGAPILAVLDSYGGGSTQALLRRFASRNACEVLVTVEPQHFVRCLDPGRADEVFGSRDWRAIEELPANQKRQFIAERLVEAMHAAGFTYVLSFSLESRKGNELLLQFGSNHPRGVEKFKDSIWRADPIGGAKFRDPNDPDQMLLELAAEPALSPLRRLLLAELANNPDRTATIEQLRTFTREHTIYREAHTTPALEGLRARQEISTQPNQKIIRPHTPRAVRVTAPEAVQAGLFD